MMSLPVIPLLGALACSTPAPPPPPGALTLALTGNLEGEIEPCG